MKRKIYFELFSTAKYNGELIGADCEKYLCPLSRIVHNCGYKGLFLVSGGPSSGKSSNITSFKIHLIKEHKEFIYYDLAELNFKTLTKPKNIPHNCIVIFDSLDEVQSRRCVRNAERLDGIRKEAEELINSFTNDENVVCVIIGSRFNPSRTKIEGYSNNFLKEFEEIVLSELTGDQIDALIEKFKLNVERDSFAYTLFKTPMYLSMAVEMGEVDKEIEDEASFIEAYLNKVHQTKQPQNDKKDSFVNGSLFELAYETIRGRICNKDISIPTAFNSIFGLSIEEEGKFLTSSSIRYINFSAAKYIVNKLYQLYQEDDIDEKHVKRLLDFVVESDNLEMLKFSGELLRHHPIKESIVQELNASGLKQNTEWYYNLTLILILHFKRSIDNVKFTRDDFRSPMQFDVETAIMDSEFDVGECFLPMYLARHDKHYHFAFFYDKIDVYWERLFTFNQIIPTVIYIILATINKCSSKYLKKTIVNGNIYLGSENKPYMCFLDHINHEQEKNPFNPFRKSLTTTIQIKKACSWISKDICQQVDKFEVEEKNECFASIDGVLFDITGTKLIRFPAFKAGKIYDDPEEAINQEIVKFVRCNESLKFPSLVATDTYTVPENVTSIANDAFAHCDGLVELFVPKKNGIDRDELYEKCSLPRKCKVTYY